MGTAVFNNEFFDQWLNQKSNEILAKVENQKLSSEDMLILSLKAQVNHFHHMDIEFREEFKKIDKRFERQSSILMWGFGLFITTQIGILLKLYL